jgi:peptidoglycan/LPS O-acetylase OafA/YrhL
VVAAAVILVGVGLVGGAASGQTEEFTGGLHWQAFATAMIEGVLAVAGSLWVLEYFRRRFTWQEPLARRLTRCAYGAYVVHEPILVGFAAILLPLSLPVEIDIMLLAPAAVVASFALTWFVVIRKHWASRIL